MQESHKVRLVYTKHIPATNTFIVALLVLFIICSYVTLTSVSFNFIKKGYKTMQLLAIYKNKLASHYKYKNLKTYIYSTTLVVNVLLPEQV